MKKTKTRSTPRSTPWMDAQKGESGQAAILLLVILATFLLGAVGLAVDLSNLWFHRQAAQTAADSSCLAGAMDMLYLNNGKLTSSPGLTVGTAGDCNTSSSTAMCQYAGFNGYVETTSAAGWGSGTPAGAVAVNWTFPAAVTGVTTSPGASNPFLKVVVQENVRTWFMGLLGVSKMTAAAASTCGLPAGPAAPPLVILNPTIGSALTISGGAHIVITGGPTASIAVDSSANGSPTSNNASNALYCSGGNGYPIDTSAAGPTGQGGKLDIVGGPATNVVCGAQTTLNDPTNTLWKSSAPAVSDTYASVFVPTRPSGKVAEAVTPVATVAQGYTPTSDPTYGYIYGTWVASGTDSCPNTAAQQHYITYSSTYPYHSGNIYGNCLEFSPGYYPTGINTTSLAGYANDVVIFMPGVYYLNGNLTVGSATTIRNAWIGSQPSTQGVMFYFLTGGPQFSGGSGAASSYINSVPSYYFNCLSTSTPSGMPASLTGNVLASQCAASGTYVGSPSSDSCSTNGLRGLLFFTDHSDTYNATLMGAGATLNFTGALYFHNSSYADVVGFDGAGTSTTYALGNMVVDQLNLSGSGTIHMGLTGTSVAGPPEVGIFQ
jgi:hypothetical protein